MQRVEVTTKAFLNRDAIPAAGRDFGSANQTATLANEGGRCR
jgi:hypothetical protein